MKDCGLGFISIGRVLESALVGSLDLAPIPLPADLTALEGEWKGERARLVARAYEGPRVQFARMVEVHTGGVEIANLLVLAEPALGAPIFGVDLVALRPDAGLAVADLSPITADPDLRAAQLARLSTRVATLPVLDPAGELPAWARAWFSPHPLFARVTPQNVADVRAWLDTLCSLLVELTLTAEPDVPVSAERVAANQRAYCRAHLEDDRGLQMLTRMFDRSRAQRVLTEIMFPVDRSVRQ